MAINKKIAEINEALIAGNLHEIDSAVMAYLMPALIDRMNDEDLKKIVCYCKRIGFEILQRIADKDYFTPQINASSADSITIKNANRRSFQFFANASNTRLHFRGEDYTLQHTHIHFEKEGEENEYDLDGKKFDGNRHTVFELKHKGNADKKRLMAIGFPLQLDEKDNPKVKQLIDSMNNLAEIKQWREAVKSWHNHPEGKQPELTLDMKKLEMTTNYKELFMTYFDHARESNSLIYHSWASLRANQNEPRTYAFRAGLRFVIAPEPY